MSSYGAHEFNPKWQNKHVNWRKKNVSGEWRKAEEYN